ncbi:MAG TPA: HD domain-containing protein [Armatimonadota bacterium]|jgi:hypothetical protein
MANLTRQEFVQELRSEWPSDDLMGLIPFGMQMEALGKAGEPYQDGAHVQKTLSCMRDLIYGQAVAALEDAAKPEDAAGETEFLRVCGLVLGSQGILAGSMGWDKAQELLMVAAFYHDIGKAIHRDRHPLEGYQYILNVRPDESVRLRELLGGGEDYRLLCQLIRYHDLFGVVGTGEGSAAVLVDALALHSSSAREQKAILSLLLVLNLADISGTVPLKSRKAGTLATDWQRLCSAVDTAGGDRQKFGEILIRSEQSPAAAIERIRRLLVERAPEELVPFLSRVDTIADIVTTTMGTQFYDFWSDFALVCKLDYALRFIGRLGASALYRRARARFTEDDLLATPDVRSQLQRVGLRVGARTTDVSALNLLQDRRMLGVGKGWAAWLKGLPEWYKGYGLEPKMRSITAGLARELLQDLNKMGAEPTADSNRVLNRLILEDVCSLPKAGAYEQSAKAVIGVVVELLKELVHSYSLLTKRPDDSRRRIGIETSAWTRTPQIRDSITELLLSEERRRGIGWAAEEATAWYMSA